MNDLYDQLRPADESLDQATAARVWARISGELPVGETDGSESDNGSDLCCGVSTRFTEQRGTGRRPSRSSIRGVGSWAAAVVVIAGLGTTAAIVASRDTVVVPSDSIAPVVPVPETNSSETSTPFELGSDETGAVPATTAPISAAVGTQFAVVDHVPEGWALDELRATSSGSIFGGESWALVDSEGRVTGVVSVRAPRPVDSEEEAQFLSDDPNTTVRGLPASEGQQGFEGGNTVPRSWVGWIEDSSQMYVTATLDAQPFVRPVVEALVIDETTGDMSIPDSLGLTPVPELGFVDPSAVTTIIAMSPIPGTPGVSVYAKPNTLDDSLEQLVEDFSVEWDDVLIEDREAIVTTTPGGGRWVAWLEDGMYVLVQSSIVISDGELFDIARGVRFTDADEYGGIANELAEERTEEIDSWEVFDRTSTPTRIDVTIRSRPGSPGANAICIETAEPDCTAINSENGIIDGFVEYASAAFDIDSDTAIGVAWVSNDLTIDSMRPVELSDVDLRPGEFLNPDDGFASGTTATVEVTNRTEMGRFAVVHFPADERPPTIRFVAAGVDPATAGTDTSFDLTPDTPDRTGS